MGDVDRETCKTGRQKEAAIGHTARTVSQADAGRRDWSHGPIESLSIPFPGAKLDAGPNFAGRRTIAAHADSPTDRLARMVIAPLRATARPHSLTAGGSIAYPRHVQKPADRDMRDSHCACTGHTHRPPV